MSLCAFDCAANLTCEHAATAGSCSADVGELHGMCLDCKHGGMHGKDHMESCNGPEMNLLSPCGVADLSELTLVDLYEGVSWVTLSPLLQSMGATLEGDFWLLDSGASSTVMKESELERFMHSEIVPSGVKFLAANGTQVEAKGKCQVAVKALVVDKKGKLRCAVFHVPVIIGSTQYNILSTTQLGKDDWEVTFGKDKVCLKHLPSGATAMDTMFWCDTPWLKLEPYHGESVRFVQQVSCHDVEETKQTLQAIRRGEQDEMEVHRLKGHVPFHPNCVHCAKSKGVSHHRKRNNGVLSSEISADFMYFNLTGESISEGERNQDSVRVLVLKESFSSSIGAIVMTDNVVRDRSLLSRWLFEFGLNPASSSVVLVTDSEEAVSSFVVRGSSQFNFLVRKAGPQEHQQVGHAERSVRIVRESLKTLQSDFESMRACLDFRPDVIQALLTYVCFSHNNHAKAFGSDRSPREIVAGRPMALDRFALFGSKILAEIPQSIASLNPNLPRFVDGCFLHPQFSSMGTMVFAMIRVRNELQPKIFVAKSFKLIFPVELDFHSGLFNVLRISGEQGAEPPHLGKPSVSRFLPPSKNVPLQAPVSGPPKEFVVRQGATSGCRACEAIAQGRSRKGLVHSKQCSQQYEVWLRGQITGSEDVEQPVEDVAVDEEATGSGLDEGSNVIDQAGIKDVMRDVMLSADYEPSILGADDGVQDEHLVGRSVDLHEIPEDVQPQPKRAKFMMTRGCPSCESGMNAPGIRHSKQCKRNRAAIMTAEPADKEVAGEEPLDAQVEGRKRPLDVGDEFEKLDRDVRPLKRRSDTAVADLENEMADESTPSGFEDLRCMLQVATCLTSPEIDLVDSLLFSLKFDANATSVVIPFGNMKIRVWRPASAVDDSTLDDLSGEQTLEGMIKELKTMETQGVGTLYSSQGFENLKLKEPTILFHVIGTRWVTVQKTEATVRSRMVIKDVARHAASARALGISSPTPSSDALSFLIGLAGARDWVLGSADAGHAFMATPLRVQDVVIKFPLSVSTLSGEPLYMRLHRALNGLRQSSQDWVVYFSSIVKKCNRALEPCLFSGILSTTGNPCGLLVYVDDVLVVAPSVSDVDFVFKAIEKEVTLKRTGLIEGSAKGGQLQFLGRLITRQKGESSVLVSLPTSFLDKTFKEYGLTGKGSSVPPDLTVHIEKLDGSPLSSEAYKRFRSALGKVAWLSQTRQDLRAYVGLLATQQSAPTNHTETALRALLRFLQNDMHVVVRHPAQSKILWSNGLFQGKPHLVCFSDASHAPLRSTKRRGISGGCLSFAGCIIKTLSRHQQAVSLSSMESELFALQAVAQEMCALGQVIGRVLMSFNESETDEIPGVLYTDSESSLQLLKNMDVPRRSRHLEVRIEWLKAKVNEGKLILSFFAKEQKTQAIC